MIRPPPRSTLFPYTTLFRSETRNAALPCFESPTLVELDGLANDGLAAFGQGREVLPHGRSEEHTSELQSRRDLVCRLLLEKKKKTVIPQRGTAVTSCSATFT